VSALGRAWRRFRIRRERAARRAIRMAELHPELLAGAERWAVKPHFLAWTAELLESGQTSGYIIDAVRREQGQ
jgi:hypothetical protein